jgi:hypothetical protein
MSMWLSEDEGWNGQDRRLPTFAAPLSVHGSERDIGLGLLDASRLRIDVSLASEQTNRESLCRAMLAIRASRLRIGSTDKLIEQIWTDKS